MDIFDSLKKEHADVRNMLEKLMGDPVDEELFKKLDHELDLHMNGEEKYIYPETKKAGLSEETLEAIEEHHVAKMIQKELKKMSPEEENFLAKIKVFKENVEHHIEEEESLLFPHGEEKLDEMTLALMEKNYQGYKAKKSAGHKS